MVYSIKVWGIDGSGLIDFTIVEVGVNLCLVSVHIVSEQFLLDRIGNSVVYNGYNFFSLSLSLNSSDYPMCSSIRLSYCRSIKYLLYTLLNLKKKILHFYLK